MNRTLPKLAAEFAGTFAAVFLSAGAICADQFLRTANSPGIGVVGIALAYGMAFAAMTAAFARVSGAHFNPAITIGFWATRRMGLFDCLSYCVAQLAGALAAAYLLQFVMPDQAWRSAALGTPAIATGVTRMPAMLIEAAMTFFLALVVLASAAPEPRATPRRASLASLASGFVITAAVLFGYPFTGAAMNPARAFGPALVSRHWNNHGVYWIGPLAGAVVAAVVYSALFPLAESRRNETSVRT